MLRGVVQAATGKLNITALGAGAVSAAAFHSWPLFALGGVAYAALAAWDLASESFWKRLSETPEAVDALPKSREVEDAEVRAAVERIQAARGAIERALGEASDDVAAHVRLSLIGLDELNGRAARLVDLAEGLARHLRRVDVNALQTEVMRLDHKAKSAQDAESRQLYAQAATDRKEELKALDDVARSRERILANLTRIVSHLEGVPTRVVRMRVLDAESGEGPSDEIGSEIGRMNGELAALEQTLEVLVGDKA